VVGRLTATNGRIRQIGSALALPGALILSALGMASAISSPEHWWLGWITLLPMFHAIRVLTPSRAALCGGVWGASVFSFCLGAFDTTVSLTAQSFVVMSAVPALYAFLGARLTARVGFSPYLLALGWMGVEFALAPVGLRHGLVASTQDGGLLLGAFGSFTGYVLIAFLVAYVNATLLSALHSVQAAARGARLVARAGDDPKPVVLDAAFYHFFLQVCRARPRAPPAR